MVEAEKIRAGMTEIFSDVFMRDDIVIDPSLTARDVEGWDSFKQVEIIMATEERFHLRFTSMEVDGLRSLGDLMAIVAARGS